jgi:uncharacterized protein YciI
MENNSLNENPLHVFVIIAETLEGWKNPSSTEGNIFLQKHYGWLAALKNSAKLLLSRPTDFELTSTGKISAIGHTNGLIMLHVESREEAEKSAFEDPFHTNGFRKKAVHSMKITMTENTLSI